MLLIFVHAAAAWADIVVNIAVVVASVLGGVALVALVVVLTSCFFVFCVFVVLVLVLEEQDFLGTLEKLAWLRSADWCLTQICR